MFLLATAAAAAPQTTIEKLKQVPSHTWWLIGLSIFGVFIGIVIVRNILAGANKLVLCGLVVLVVGLLMMQWVYERTEPAFLTPVVNYVAPFFPSSPTIKPTPKTAH
jgi:FtsH-binding integral membrane protein